jgi:hypothetical protein
VLSRRLLGRRTASCSALVAGAALLAACGTPLTSSSPTTTTTRPVVLCPLTGTPSPGGAIPKRPALVMKVDNYGLGPAPNGARPQSGLDAADVIFEEQVEGSITRYAAVFQCHQAPGLVGPVRSARVIDIGILSELDSPLLVHVGGIVPVINRIDASTIRNVDLGSFANLDVYPPGRNAPYDTYTHTSWVWAQYKARNTPPDPIFTYSKFPHGGRPATQIHLDWSYTSDIYWRWSTQSGAWKRYYNVASAGTPVIEPDLLANGVQNQVQNVVVQVVHITYGPWFENFQGGLEVQAKIADNSGRAYVFRNGRMIAGRWRHGSLTSRTIFTNAAGKVITLEPGRTWVEIFPDIDPVSVTFPAPRRH